MIVKQCHSMLYGVCTMCRNVLCCAMQCVVVFYDSVWCGGVHSVHCAECNACRVHGTVRAVYSAQAPCVGCGVRTAQSAGGSAVRGVCSQIVQRVQCAVYRAHSVLCAECAMCSVQSVQSALCSVLLCPLLSPGSALPQCKAPFVFVLARERNAIYFNSSHSSKR